MNSKMVLTYLLVLGIVTIVSYGTNQIYEYKNGWQEFREYHVERAGYMDYPHIAYANSPELYEEQGWTENLTALVGQWYFIDEHVTEESFAALNNAIKDAEIDFRYRLSIMKGLLLGEKAVCIQEIVWILLLIITSIALYKKRKLKNIFEIWGYFGAFSVLAIYFAYQGRLPLRVYETLIYIFFIPSIFRMLEIMEYFRDNMKEINRYGTIILGLCCVIVIQMQGGMWNKAYNCSHEETRENGIRTKSAVERYVIEHNENLYIYDVSLTMSGNPFTIYPDTKPYNLLFWGGSGMYSPLYYQQLMANGMTSLDSEDFFDDKIYFIGKVEISELLYDYMKELYPGCTCNIVHVTDEFIVYKFAR